MTNEKQAELIAIACREAGLDGHIKWIERSSDAHTYAERIANGIRLGNVKRLPVKNSYMYCDTLDMCFFYINDVPYMSYAGYVTGNSKDIMEDKLVKAFQTSKQVLSRMKELAENR